MPSSKQTPKPPRGRLARTIDSAHRLLVSGKFREALKSVRTILRLGTKTDAAVISAAGILIDAGAALHQHGLIRRGVRLLEDHLERVRPENRQALLYNLGTGCCELGLRQRGTGPGTRVEFASAVSRFDEALVDAPSLQIRVNLANALRGQGRLIEALDEYDAIIAENPSQHEAHANRAQTLRRIHSLMFPHAGLVEAAALDMKSALLSSQHDHVFHQRYLGLAEFYMSTPLPPTRARRSPLIEWIWQSGTSLNVCPLCRQDTPNAFDIYPLPGHLTAKRRRPHGRTVVDMCNALVRSFAAARWIAAQGLGIAGALPTDHVVTLPGSTGATTSLRVGLLLNAASSYYGVLNQVASALNSYFALGHSEFTIKFETVWLSVGKTKPATKRHDLHSRFRRETCPMLSALYNIALSLNIHDGRYRALRQLRNWIEHHVVVVHHGNSATRYYKSIDEVELTRCVNWIGRIARAVLLYFSAAVWRSESARAKRNHGPLNHARAVVVRN